MSNTCISFIPCCILQITSYDFSISYPFNKKRLQLSFIWFPERNWARSPPAAKSSRSATSNFWRALSPEKSRSKLARVSCSRSSAALSLHYKGCQVVSQKLWHSLFHQITLTSFLYARMHLKKILYHMANVISTTDVSGTLISR